MTLRHLTRPTTGLFLGVVLVSATACNAEKPTATATGTVTYNGTPVTTGQLNLLSKTGAGAQAKIGETGDFTIAGEIEAGEYTVFVTPPPPEPQAPGAGRAKPRTFTVPAKFRDAATSGVTVTVKPGTNTIPVEFK